MGLAGGLLVDRGRSRRRQSRVPGLPDLDRPVLDELGDDESEGRGGEEHQCNAFGGHYMSYALQLPGRPAPVCLPQHSLTRRDGAQEEDRDRA